MTGCVTLLQLGSPPQPLDTTVFEVPGDPEAIHSIRFDECCTARCILVVEKDSVFRRLINDEFTVRYLPCILVTACGFPDLVRERA
jgi:DNA topoisomerase VI subunit A